MKYLLFAFCLVAFISCGDDDPVQEPEVACTTDIVPSFRITVSNGADSSPLEGVTITARDQSFESILEVESPGVYIGPNERAGSYFLIIEKDGFQTIVTETLDVTEDECHVITVARTYSLAPL